jgi:hypothetical protein
VAWGPHTYGLRVCRPNRRRRRRGGWGRRRQERISLSGASSCFPSAAEGGEAPAELAATSTRDGGTQGCWPAVRGRRCGELAAPAMRAAARRSVAPARELRREEVCHKDGRRAD